MGSWEEITWFFSFVAEVLLRIFMFMVLLSSSMDREENELGLNSGPDPQCTL